MREHAGRGFDVGSAVASGHRPEPTREQMADHAAAVAANLDASHAEVVSALEAMLSAHRAQDHERYERARVGAQSAIARMRDLAAASKTYASEANDSTVRAKLENASALLAAAERRLSSAPPAPAQVAPTLHSRDALLAALPPAGFVHGPTKPVFDTARANVAQVIREMPFSDFVALEKILREFPDDEVSTRFRRFSPRVQGTLLSHLKDPKLRARARALEASMPKVRDSETHMAPSPVAHDATTEEGSSAPQRTAAAMPAWLLTTPKWLSRDALPSRPPMSSLGEAPARDAITVNTVDREASPGGEADLAEAIPQPRVAHQGIAAGPDAIHAVAAQGIGGAAERLPHADVIQRNFGRHDISDVVAFTGPEAAAAAEALGAKAYTIGNRVVFRGSPDLHTVAHEAAHVVQQRAGAAPNGLDGGKGDSFEIHANAVADAVVQGESAEPILDEMPSGGLGSAGSAIQRKQAEDAPVADVAATTAPYRPTWEQVVAAAADDAEVRAALDIEWIDGLPSHILEQIDVAFSKSKEDAALAQVLKQDKRLRALERERATQMKALDARRTLCANVAETPAT